MYQLKRSGRKAARAFVLLTLIAVAPFVCATEEQTERKSEAVSASSSSQAPQPLAFLNADEPDALAIAQCLVDTFLSKDQLQAEVKKLRSRFEDWEKDTGGDMTRYLNDRLVIVALGAANGKVEKIQRGILWLAFYKQFNQDSPGIVEKFIREHHNSLERLFTDFTWEKASAYVKNKEWRKDIEERKHADAAIPSAELRPSED
ncbi:MAG TPA: hypothetical protein VGP72_21980 [Planctomycetota bacterium]|jgi:hypothetical protein